MLIEFFGKNFGCFRDEFRLSLLASDIDPDSSRGIVEARVEGDSEPLRLLRAIAIYGPNGSGKSTILRAARALQHLIGAADRVRSDSPLAPYEPFILGPKTETPILLGLKAVIDSHVFEYEVEFDRTKYRHEHLIEWSISEPKTLFYRSGSQVTGEWTRDETFSLMIKAFRPNMLLLSLADKFAPKLAKDIAVGFRRLLRGFDPTHFFDLPFFMGATNIAKRVREDAEFSNWLLTQLCAADIGIVDLRTEEVRVEFLGSPTVSEDSDDADEGGSPTLRLSLMHRGESGPIALSYAQESFGTRRLVSLSPLLYDLAHAKLPLAAFVDELDASMHPILLKGLVKHFNCDTPVSSARGQLIFAAHETTLLDDEAKSAVLRRDQVYLTEKDAAGAARLYSVAEFRERNNLNLRRRYLQGRYGALPALGSFSE